jgi:phospholipid/cholesterol/gamma-HCH transport system substrate-binding protein
VKSLDFDDEGVVVRARLVRATPVTKRSRAEMVAADMFGRQSLVLRPNDGVGPPLAEGDTIFGRGPVSLTSKLERIGGQADRLLGDTMIALLRDALEGAGDATGDAGRAAASVAGLATNVDRLLARQGAELSALTAETGLLVRRLRETADGPELARMPANLDRSAANLAAATENMDSATAMLAVLLADLEAGRGSAGMLLRDVALYDRTVGTLAALERLLDDVREHPKRYINVRLF